MSVDAATERTLLGRGWQKSEGELVWRDDLGSELHFATEKAGARLTLLVDGSQVLGFQLEIAEERMPALAAALAENTETLAGLRHAPFAKAVVAIASDVVIETTDGQFVRPRLENGQISFHPVDR
jgi:hypothetical protein